MTISRVKFPWPPFFRIFIFFDEVFNTVCGTTYLMRDDGATVVNVRSSRVIWSFPNPTDVLAQPRTMGGVCPLKVNISVPPTHTTSHIQEFRILQAVEKRSLRGNPQRTVYFVTRSLPHLRSACGDLSLKTKFTLGSRTRACARCV